MKRINDVLWQSDDKLQYYKVALIDGNGCLDSCERDICPKFCARTIGHSYVFKKITKEEAEQLMAKKKFIVTFVDHDENELIDAACSEHAKILAQAKRISMGETTIAIKSVEEIKPYVIMVDKYEIHYLNGELTIKASGEDFNTNDGSKFIIMRLVRHIEEMEAAIDKKNKGLENLLAEMKKDIRDLASSGAVTRLRELIGL